MEYNITGDMGNSIITDASILAAVEQMDCQPSTFPKPLKRPELGFEQFDGIRWFGCEEHTVDSPGTIWRHRGEVGAKYKTTERRVVEYERVE